jgi:hypothetical protein
MNHTEKKKRLKHLASNALPYFTVDRVGVRFGNQTYVTVFGAFKPNTSIHSMYHCVEDLSSDEAFMKHCSECTVVFKIPDVLQTWICSFYKAANGNTTKTVWGEAEQCEEYFWDISFKDFTEKSRFYKNKENTKEDKLCHS